jgi:hypothetical protein
VAESPDGKIAYGSPGAARLLASRLCDILVVILLEYEKPHPHAEDWGFADISFGSPAFRLRGPIGFASPGYPGFAFIGKIFFCSLKLLICDLWLAV